MDRPVYEAIVRNDVATFLRLVQGNKSILEQRCATSGNTVLHLASRLGHYELVAKIVKFKPELVEAENQKLETPLHDVCRKNNPKILSLFLGTNPWAASKLNDMNQSALYVACSTGLPEMVKLLLNQRWLLDAEEDGVQVNSLQIAASRGHIDVIRMILKARPDFAQRTDKNGQSALHYACGQGHLTITKELLRLDTTLSQQYDNSGRTPLHLAAMNGKTAILNEFVSMAPNAFQAITGEGETVFHLSVRYNQHHSLMFLVQLLGDTPLLKHPDQNGNSILHLAALKGYSKIYEYLINRTKIDIFARNQDGLTALDILNGINHSSEDLDLRTIIVEGSDERSAQRSSISRIEGTDHQPEPFFESMQQRNAPDRAENLPSLGYPTEKTSPEYKVPLDENEVIQTREMREFNTKTNTSINPAKNEVERDSDIQGHNASELIKSSSKIRNNSSPNLDEQKVLSQRHREELTMLHKIRQSRQRDIHLEALQNARNTITVVAILIATVSFTAGVSPPGGLHKEGPGTRAFKIFTISNSIALFTSLCIVIVLVSIIPFQRKALMRLLVIAHKVTWVAVSFMATAFVAATWLILPPVRTDWTIEAILSISVAAWCLMLLFLTVQLGRQWLRKLKWRKEKGTRKEAATGIEVERQETQSDSSNSDVESSKFLGYHAY
ncbi:PGG domain [Dillenia turbinata]|uniref:PGG domain n=1 Tax=Dillenia turbinata TaxID=194707 RepID=A0AAN8UAR1_9MAGN